MRRQRTTMWRCNALSVAFLFGLAVPANAVDGVIEINQAMAKAGGVTPDDTPLFPVTISQPGSYRLTGNLDVTDATARPAGTAPENTTAILIGADHVTIDLNGFMIKGPTVCSGQPPTCSPLGTGIGIDASVRTGVAVMNGTVQGMGSNGVSLNHEFQSHAERLRALGNGNNGIVATTVSGSTAASNNREGIHGTTVSTCTATRNGAHGISATTVASCTATNNGGHGILATTAIGCTAEGNGGDIAAGGIKGQNMCGSPAAPCP